MSFCKTYFSQCQWAARWLKRESPKAPPDINSFVLLSDVCRTQSFELNPICHFVWQKDSLKFSQYTLNHNLLFINKDVVLDELLSSKLIEFFLAWLSKVQFFSGTNINLWETDPCLVFDWGNTSYFGIQGFSARKRVWLDFPVLHKSCLVFRRDLRADFWGGRTLTSLPWDPVCLSRRPLGAA